MASDAKGCFSSKVEYRVAIRYLYLKDKTGKEIHGELADAYGSAAPSYAQVKFWIGEFKRDRTFLEDEARFGRPLDATDEEMCKKVRELVYFDILCEKYNHLALIGGRVSDQLPASENSPLASPPQYSEPYPPPNILNLAPPPPPNIQNLHTPMYRGCSILIYNNFNR